MPRARDCNNLFPDAPAIRPTFKSDCVMKPDVDLIKPQVVPDRASLLVFQTVRCHCRVRPESSLQGPPSTYWFIHGGW
jgi:hypothetical protein